MNIVLLIRAALTLMGAVVSLTDINGWLTVMLGPDCWNYTAKELAVKAVSVTKDAAGYQRGVDAATLTTPLAQSLRYAVSGVGVHLLFIGIVLLYLAVSAPRGSALQVQIPLAMLLLDLMTVVNATGLIDPHTAGHPRCANSTFQECAAALSTFVPILVLDGLSLVLAASGVYPTAGKAKQLRVKYS